MKIELDANEAAFSALNGALLVVRCPKAYPPGQRVSLKLIAGERQDVLRAKSHGSKKLDDDQFEVTLKIFSLSNAHKAILASL